MLAFVTLSHGDTLRPGQSVKQNHRPLIRIGCRVAMGVATARFVVAVPGARASRQRPLLAELHVATVGPAGCATCSMVASSGAWGWLGQARRVAGGVRTLHPVGAGGPVRVTAAVYSSSVTRSGIEGSRDDVRASPSILGREAHYSIGDPFRPVPEPPPPPGEGSITGVYRWAGSQGPNPHDRCPEGKQTSDPQGSGVQSGHSRFVPGGCSRRGRDPAFRQPGLDARIAEEAANPTSTGSSSAL